MSATQSIVLVFLLAVPAAFEPCHGQERPLANVRKEGTWYSGAMFFWKSVFAQEEYDAMVQQLPPGQAEALRRLRLGPFHTLPLDIRNGTNAPKVTYFRSQSPLEPVLDIPDLEYLDLAGCKVDEQDLLRVAGSDITCLTLDGSNVTDTVARRVLLGEGALRKLQHLELWVEQKNGPGMSPRTLSALGQRAHPVPSLQLSGREITDDWVAELRGLKGLYGLGLYATAVTDAGIKDLSKVPDLAWLSLSQQEGLTAASLNLLTECRHLQELQLCGDRVSDEMLRTIGTELRVGIVALISTPKITVKGIGSLLRLSTLRVVVYDGMNPDVIKELGVWQRAAADRRRVFTRPDPYFGGWVSSPSVLWRQDRMRTVLPYP